MKKPTVQIKGCTIEAGYGDTSEYPTAWIRVKGPDGKLLVGETENDMEIGALEYFPILRELMIKRIHAMSVVHG